MNFSRSFPPYPAIANTTDKMLPPIVVAAGAAVVAYAGMCLALYSYQAKLIFRPLPDFLRTPDEAGLAYEDIWIPVNNGKLHGWWLPNPGSQRVLLFCHGNYGNISYNLSRICFLHSLGFSVLAFDYRGYGQSTGNQSEKLSESIPSEQSTYADAEAAWQYLLQERQLAPEQITVCGHSMGGAIAIQLATQHPDMARLIITSSFTTMQDAVDAKKIYRLFPVQQMLRHPFDSLSKVKTLQVPVLYVHGEQDADVPTHMSRELYAATPGRKELWIAPDAHHNNIYEVQGDTYAAVIQSFCGDTQLIHSQAHAA